MQSSQQKTAFVICSLVMMAVSTVFMNQAILLELSQFFSVSLPEARLSFSYVSLSYSITFLLAGPIMDQGNLRYIALYSALLLAGTLFMTPYVGTYPGFLLCMFPLGICAALIPASMFPCMALIAPEKNKGFYVGSVVAAATLGVIWGRVLCGVLTSLIGWSGAYQVIAIVVLICTVLAAVYLPSGSRKATTETSLITAYTKAYRLVFQKRSMGLMLVGSTLFFGFLGMVTFLSYRLNLSPFFFSSGEIGCISFAGITALVAPFSGHLSHKYPSEKIIFAGLCFALASSLLLGWASNVPFIILGLFLLFLSVYTCQPLIFLLVGRSVSAEFVGSASSFYIFFCIGGGSLSSMILGPVWTVYGWHGTVVACSLSIGASLILMLLLKSDKRASRNS
nr:MFS transporter [Desulfogranum japonicum]